MSETKAELIAGKVFDDFHNELIEIFELTSDSCLAYKIGMLHERMRSTLLKELKQEDG